MVTATVSSRFLTDRFELDPFAVVNSGPQQLTTNKLTPNQRTAHQPKCWRSPVGWFAVSLQRSVDLLRLILQAVNVFSNLREKRKNCA